MMHGHDEDSPGPISIVCVVCAQRRVIHSTFSNEYQDGSFIGIATQCLCGRVVGRLRKSYPTKQFYSSLEVELMDVKIVGATGRSMHQRADELRSMGEKWIAASMWASET